MEALQQASLDEAPQQARGGIPGGPEVWSYTDREDTREADNEAWVTFLAELFKWLEDKPFFGQQLWC